MGFGICYTAKFDLYHKQNSLIPFIDKKLPFIRSAIVSQGVQDETEPVLYDIINKIKLIISYG